MYDYSNMGITDLIDVCKTGTKQQRNFAMEEIVNRNDKLVAHVINKSFANYRSKHYEDMAQEGRSAICLHACDFDASRGTFSTFMVPYITDAIKTYICEFHGITAHYASMYKRFNKAVEKLNEMGITNPTIGDIAEMMGVGLSAAQHIYEIASSINPVSIEGDGKDKELTDEYSASPDALVERDELKRMLFAAIAQLSDDEKDVIRETYFSDSSNRETPLNVVAERLGMDVSNVRRIKNLALRKLHNSPQLTGTYAATKSRRELEEFADGLSITFVLPAGAVNANIDLALDLDFGDDEDDYEDEDLDLFDAEEYEDNDDDDDEDDEDDEE